jgi:hypothetical protein
MEFTLPGSSKWRALISTADGFEGDVEATSVASVPPRSLLLLQSQ